MTCRRHEWTWRGETPADGEWCRFCHHVRDAAVSRTNRNNRKRGNRTSHDLAAYLPNGRNVEALKLPWDVEAPGCRIQSKRLAERPSWAAIKGLLDYIGPSDDLAAVYTVGPRERLTSGDIWVEYRRWVEWHGWQVPRTCLLTIEPAGTVLLSMPLPTFRDLHIGEKP